MIRFQEITGAISEVPALATITWFMHSVIGAVPFLNQFFAGLPESSSNAMQWMCSLLLAMVLHVVGYFWDGRFYDPRYSTGGTWIGKDHPWGIFPSGAKLERNRQAARIRLLTEDERDDPNVSVYDRAELIVSVHGRYGDAAGPEILSKFARSLIMPAFAATVVLTIIFLYRALSGQDSSSWQVGRLAVVTLVIGSVAFVPYVHFRVKHMNKLYSLAVLLKSGEVPSTTA